MRLVILDWATMTAHEDLSPECFRPFADEIDRYNLTSPGEAAARIGDAELVLCNKVPITGEVIEACPNLKYIGLFATGYNNVDIPAATARGIRVCNAGSYSTNAVAQLVFAFMLDHFSKLPLYNLDVRQGKWCTSPTFSYFPYPTMELAGKTLSVIGFGSIGKAVAKIADAFGMQVLVSTRTVPAHAPYPMVTLAEAFARADVLTLHCPLTEDTSQLVNAIRLGSMKRLHGRNWVRWTFISSSPSSGSSPASARWMSRRIFSMRKAFSPNRRKPKIITIPAGRTSSTSEAPLPDVPERRRTAGTAPGYY